MDFFNQFNQPIGRPLPDWTPRPLPSDIILQGRVCMLEPLGTKHVSDLYAAYSLASDPRDWTYLPTERFASEDDYRQYVENVITGSDPKHFAIIDSKTNRAVGTLALMRIDPSMGVVEVGYVTFSPLLQRKTAATEAHYLLMKYAFETLGYRRYEWKCDSLNLPSRKAAERLGFTFEGIFRQAVVYKGRSRDTAWFSITDQEWPSCESAFQQWLSPANFDADNVQQKSLHQIRQDQATIRTATNKEQG
jgi:RimJ/RimL family protein N-acetyltransferase